MAAMLANEEGQKGGAGHASDGKHSDSSEAAVVDGDATKADMPQATTKRAAATQTSAYSAQAQAGCAGKLPSEVTWHVPLTDASRQRACGVALPAHLWKRRAEEALAAAQEHAPVAVDHLPSVVTWHCPPVTRRVAAAEALRPIAGSTAASAGQPLGVEASSDCEQDSEEEASSTPALCPCAAVASCCTQCRRRACALGQDELMSISSCRAHQSLLLQHLPECLVSVSRAASSICSCVSACLCVCVKAGMDTHMRE